MRRRLKRFGIYSSTMLRVMDGTMRVDMSSLPKDAVLVGVMQSSENWGFYVLVSSQEFEPLNPGEIIPMVEVEMEMIK